MSTDRDWQRWGEQDPYFGVITSEQFRRGAMTPASRAAFFETGFHHVAGVMATCRRLFQADFSPRRVLDFGCGVGRVLVPLARLSTHAVGVDVSPAMLEEAARNCDAHGLANVEFLPSDDQLSAVTGEFDLVHSVITLQHIPVARGLQILRRLIARLSAGGIGVVQLTYAKAWHPQTHGQPPPAPLADIARQPLIRGLLRRTRRPAATAADTQAAASDPAMLMHAYPLGEVAYLMQTAGITGFHAEFTDHGGELGMFLYFQKPRPPAAPA